MTKIKLCGLSRPQDIEAANALGPEYIGFVFAKGSRRYVSPETAAELKSKLDPSIRAVGVFVNEAPEEVARLLNEGIIDIAQLHGAEDEAYIRKLRELADKPVIKAFRMDAEDAESVPARASECSADAILLDSGAGSGMTFNWKALKNFTREYFLAGGLNPDNVAEAIRELHPAAVDVSSGIETEGRKDAAKMRQLVDAVRKEDGK